MKKALSLNLEGAGGKESLELGISQGSLPAFPRQGMSDLSHVLAMSFSPCFSFYHLIGMAALPHCLAQ